MKQFRIIDVRWQSFIIISALIIGFLPGAAEAQDLAKPELIERPALPDLPPVLLSSSGGFMGSSLSV